MDFWNKLEAARSRWNVLEHPFYQRWSDGELTQAELATYSGQYRYAVQALAQRSGYAAAQAESQLQDQLEVHAAEERSHVDLWDNFMNEVGGCESKATAKTAACAQTWATDGDKSLLETLVGLYAIESGQPAISETKRAGLKQCYGFETGNATAYFDLHATLDIEHAAEARELIEQRLEGANEEQLLAEAEAVLRANWELLDGVEELNGRDSIACAA